MALRCALIAVGMFLFGIHVAAAANTCVHKSDAQAGSGWWYGDLLYFTKAECLKMEKMDREYEELKEKPKGPLGNPGAFHGSTIGEATTYCAIIYKNHNATQKKKFIPGCATHTLEWAIQARKNPTGETAAWLKDDRIYQQSLGGKPAGGPQAPAAAQAVPAESPPKKTKQATGDQTKCVTYDSKTGWWINKCQVPVLISYSATGCKDAMEGTAGPVKARNRGDYNPLLKACALRFRACDYNAWVAGTCALH